MVRCGPTHDSLDSPLRILREVVCNGVPGSAAFHERVKLRPNTRIIIECSHANRDLFAVRPITTEQTRTAIYAKGFHGALALPIDFDHLFSLYQSELPSQDAGLGTNRSSRMLATTVAVTVARLKEWRVDLELHSTTQATTVDRVRHNTKHI